MSEEQMSPAILARILEAQQESRNLYQQLGQLEVRKYQLILRLEQINEGVRQLMSVEGMRLGVPEGTSWQVTPEGKILLTPQG